MTNRERLWFWFGVALRQDEATWQEIDEIRHHAEAVLGQARVSSDDLRDATWRHLHHLNPYLHHVQALADAVWPEQFRSYEGDPFKHQRYDQD